jgi:dynein heavy chain 1
LYDVVVLFQEKATALLMRNATVQTALESIRTCSVLKPNGFAENLSQIQQTVDSMSLAEDRQRNESSNLRPWVSELNKIIEEILLSRLKELVELFANNYHQIMEGTRGELFSVLIPFRIEIKMHHRKITTSPPIHQMRTYWYDQFSACLSWICGNLVIRGDRFDRALTKTTSAFQQEQQTYKYLLSYLSQDLLSNAYHEIEKSMITVDQYISQWLKYQSLWGLNLNDLFVQVGSNLKKWLTLLTDIKKARAAMDRTNGESLEQV